MANDTDWDPSVIQDETPDDLTLDSLTLQNLTRTIRRPCDNECGKSATAFLGYLQGNALDKANWTSRGGDDELEDSPTLDVPLFALDRFVRGCAPPEMEITVGYYSEGAVADWFLTTGNDESLLSLINHTRTECFPEFCKALTWKGNPDVSGIGVSSAVYIHRLRPNRVIANVWKHRST